MYYATIRVEVTEGHEHESIDEAIKQSMSKLVAEAGVPLVLTNVIPVFFSSIQPPCLVIMAKPYDEPARVVGAKIAPEGIARIMQNRGLLG